MTILETRTPREARPPVADHTPILAGGGALPGWTVEVALVLVTFASLVGIHRVFRGWGSIWVMPIFGTALLTVVICRLTRRYIPNPLVAALVDALGVVLLAVWTVIPGSTRFGVPVGRTWTTLDDAFANIANRLNAAATPVVPDTAFRFVAVIGAGAIALLGSWLVMRLGRVLVGVVPSFACFVVCCSIGSRTDRTMATAVEVAGLCLFLLVAQGARPGPGGVLIGRRRPGPAANHFTLGAVVAAMAILAAAVTAPALTGPNGHGPLGWNVLYPSHDRIVISPLVDLKTRLLTEGNKKAFTVTSTEPSYWRLTSLDYFDGNQWSANDTYEGVDGSLPGIKKLPGTRQVTENFDIQDLDSVWVPLAFDPETVSGAGKVSYDSRSGSLLTAQATSNGLRYKVTSLEYLADLSSKALTAAPSLTHADPPSGYLQLPSTIPARIKRLARRLTAGKRTEYAKAYALQQFFHTSEFTYTLDPPSDGSSDNALYNFLFSTHKGYCQQFAGSFAVLARLVGLPTRLAVGFTQGTPEGQDTYEITDADAHTWPEVWFPKYGWVPFEPTKGETGHGFLIPGASGYTGDTASTTPTTTPSSTATTLPSATTSSPTGPTTPTTAATSSGSSTTVPVSPRQHHEQGGNSGATAPTTTPAATATRHRAGDSGTIFLIALAGLAVLLVLLVSSNVTLRRLRWHRRWRRVPALPDEAHGAATILAVWGEVQEVLAWQGVKRRPSETYTEMASRVATRHEFDRRGPGHGRPADELQQLAQMATRATYTGAVPDDVAAEAQAAGQDVRAILKLYRTGRHRLRLIVDPRLSWVDPARVRAEPVDARSTYAPRPSQP